MKRLTYFFLFAFLLPNLVVQAQTDIQSNKRIDALLKLAARNPAMSVYSRKNEAGKYVNIAALVPGAHVLKWFNCYGTTFDSAYLKDEEYREIRSGRLDPFSVYRQLCRENIRHIQNMRSIYRLRGKELQKFHESMKWSARLDTGIYNLAFLAENKFQLQELVKELNKRI